MANGVAIGRILFMVGHCPIDPTTGAATAAAGPVQVSVKMVAALDPRRWGIVVAEERPRPVAGTGVDAVLRARRLSCYHGTKRRALVRHARQASLEGLETRAWGRCPRG